MDGSGGTGESGGQQRAVPVAQEPAVRRPRRRGALAAAGVAGVVALAGIGSVAYAALSGGGSQPESQVPADALVYAEVDLDPPAGEKVDLLRLARRFPDLVPAGEEDLRAVLLRSPLAASGLDYDRDVAPWLGDRAGVAVLPPADEATEPTTLLVLQSTDDTAAGQGLARLREAGGEQFGWTVRDGWVLVAATQAQAERVAAAAETEALADDPTYAGDVDRLDGDRVVTVWADLAGLLRAAQADQAALGDAASPADALAPVLSGGLPARADEMGRLVVGAGAGPDHLELEARTVGATYPLPEPGGDLGGLVGGLPDDTVGAFGLSGYGPLLLEEWARLESDPATAQWPAQARDAVAGLGFTLPDDLATLTGDHLVASVGPLGDGEALPDLGLRTVGEPVAVQGLFGRIADLLPSEAGVPVVLRDTPDGAVLASSDAAADGLAALDGHLAHDDRFDSALPDADDAWALVYVDLAAVVDALAGRSAEPVPTAIEPLSALGLTAARDGDDQVVRVRLVVR